MNTALSPGRALSAASFLLWGTSAAPASPLEASGISKPCGARPMSAKDREAGKMKTSGSGSGSMSGSMSGSGSLAASEGMGNSAVTSGSAG